jgi:glycosyltransferase involved in cell wall biosynthesis
LPNISGFLKYVAPALPRLRPTTRIVVAGSVSDGLDTEASQASLRGCREGRLISLGFVDDLTLDALIANASALLLPIEYGGGSQLKTAEALSSGRPIIGTSTSFRGYTAYQDLPHVILADTPDQFESAIHHSLSCALPPGEDLLPRELLWESTLEPVVQLARHLNVFRARHYELVPAN